MMDSPRAEHRALALLSGGLDSMLAARVMQELGVSVVGVTFASPFFSPALGLAAAERIGVPHRVIDVTAEIVELVKKPKHGYGRHMNPCVDCHAMMIRTAGGMLPAEGASFVVTGEVLGERPKSQNERALRAVESESGLEGLVLRPLSARLLDETIPEREGWVDRSRLHDICGRSRHRQFELARAFGIESYPTPGGGCRLTQGSYAGRLAPLLATHPEAERSSFMLLAVGRHTWRDGALIVVGRDREENAALTALASPDDAVLRLTSDLGPTTLVRWPTEDAVADAVTMTARYSQERDQREVRLLLRPAGGGPEQEILSTAHRELRDFALIE